ncbi:MAG: winged helix-turn-helix domain-containing protein, partial [Acetobacteraceae bacterium]
MPVTHKMGPFRLDAEAGVLYRGDVVTLIGKRGVDLLRAMVSQPGVVIAKQKLIDAAWPGLVMEESNLSVQIASLRQTLAEEPGAESWIETKPRHGYRYVGPVETVTDTSRPSPDPSTKAEGPRALNLPSIVVLPFVNLSGPVERDYLGDAISEDIITALVRFRWFSVVSRDASFACHDDHTVERVIAVRFEVRYVLSGCHRWLGDRARVTA